MISKHLPVAELFGEHAEGFDRENELIVGVGYHAVQFYGSWCQCIRNGTGVLEGCELRGLKRVIVLHRLVTGGKKGNRDRWGEKRK